MTADFFQLIGSLFRILKELFSNTLAGLNTEKFEKKFTGNASWGVGPNTEKFEKKFYRQCMLGWDNEINFEKISFLFHSHWHFCSSNAIRIYV